tara:strand:- start:273 stop:491 length:219 start_codon:yes stop_codon:yes gene_type:complete
MEIVGGIAVMTIALYFLTRPSQEDRDRWSEIRERGKAERKAELKKIRQETNTPFWWIMRIAFFGGLIFFFLM